MDHNPVSVAASLAFAVLSGLAVYGALVETFGLVADLARRRRVHHAVGMDAWALDPDRYSLAAMEARHRAADERRAERTARHLRREADLADRADLACRLAGTAPDLAPYGDALN